jgi:hypothetical protein
MSKNKSPVPGWVRPWPVFVASKLSGAQWSALRSIAAAGNAPTGADFRVTTVSALLRWQLIEGREGVPVATDLGRAVLSEGERPGI